MKALRHRDYIRKVRNDLPPEAFSPVPRKLIRMFGYVALIGVACVTFRLSSPILVHVLLSMFIGNTLACVAFLAHELSHGAIVRSRILRYACEFFFWGLLLIPATMWRRVHNQTHHTHASTARDPDRAFFRSESSRLTRCYSRIFYPSNQNLRWNPIVAFHFIPYILRNILASFYKSSAKPPIVPAKPSYSMTEHIAIVCELGGVLALQVAIYLAVGSNWIAYFWASPAAYLITSAVTMTYIFTNHFLNPISEASDPLLGTTSVVVPRLFNRLHENFSFHTEHHLFPTINSAFYPVVTAALQKHFPDRYNRLRLLEAWRRLWQSNEFVDEQFKCSHCPGRQMNGERLSSMRSPSPTSCHHCK